MTSLNSSPSNTALIYIGGTFGCAGTPLSPLTADVFLPHLKNICQSNTEYAIDFFYAQQIRDSSQLEPQDWQALILQIESLRQQRYTHFLIIHGTDTLAYSAAFLAEFYQQQDLSIMLTGSQYPLLDAQDLSLNLDSDALDNLTYALRTLSDLERGVWVAFNQQHWPAQRVQKIHTHEKNAFAGDPHAIVFSPTKTSPTEEIKSAHLLADLENLAQINIAVFYCVPMSVDQLWQQLNQLLTTPKLNALILLAFGSGNMPYDVKIAELLNNALQRGIWVVLSTQVPFGGTASLYAAGSWLSDLGILSSQHLPLPALYARIAWICCQYQTIEQRKQHFIDLTR